MVSFIIFSFVLWRPIFTDDVTQWRVLEWETTHSLQHDEAESIRISHLGVTLDHDYYVADQLPENKNLLSLVETFHLNKQVMDNFGSGKYDLALQDIKYTLERFPNHPKALLIIGSIAKLKGELLLPLPYYKRALQLFPQYAQTHALYGSYLVDMNSVDTGLAELNKAIKMDPNLAIAHAWLAKAYYRIGNRESARQAAEQARLLGYKGDIEVGGVKKKD